MIAADGHRSLQRPLVAVFVVIILLDSQERPRLTDGPLIREGVLTHGVRLAPAVVVLDQEAAFLFIKNSSHFARTGRALHCWMSRVVTRLMWVGNAS